MSRKPKGPRLWLQPARFRDGKIDQVAVWVIRDGPKKTSTGCGEANIAEAEKRLAAYITGKHDPAAGRNLGPEHVIVADVLSLYSTDRAIKHARPHETLARVGRLLDHFGEKTAAEITGRECRTYAAQRGAASAARRELEDLRAALRYYWQEGHIDRHIPVTLPDKSESRERWLTRSEAARLLWAAWRLRQKYRGEDTERATAKHVARFMLVALYTGTRAGAVCGAAIRPTVGGGYVDLERGILYRKAPGAKQTNKRQPPVTLPDRLLAHLRRWESMGISQRYVVEWNGQPVSRINKAFRAVREAAGFGEEVVPHTLRHTAATWITQNGASISEGADYVGMSVETFDRIYRHHSPSHQEGARAAISARPPKLSGNLSGRRRSI